MAQMLIAEHNSFLQNSSDSNVSPECLSMIFFFTSFFGSFIIFYSPRLS